ncbi:MAG: DUF2716 domain-containing protein [Chloroflexota bacterium]|nr:DUF2716 domain-containing protein [Chloroflexota bacterium]
MPNTPPPPPIERRSSSDLLEDLCLELRHVAVRESWLPEHRDNHANIEKVRQIHAELERRGIDIAERIAQLSIQTNWQMDALLQDCLAYPKTVPLVRESDGVRRALRCFLCAKREMPDHNGIELCDTCLDVAARCIETKLPVDDLVVYRSYTPSKWCEHADGDTVLVALDGGDWIGEGYCKLCIAQERTRREVLNKEMALAEPEGTEEAWAELLHHERDAVWDRFYALFDFKPSTKAKVWPGIKEPTPSITYSIASFYKTTSNPRVLERDLNIKTLQALRKCVPPGQRLYALDWQHPCYWFYPHRLEAAGDTYRWRVPVLPNGDYYIFLAEDLSFGLFGHPWEQTLCVFGQALLNAFAQDMPLLFGKPVRRDGKTA